MALMYTGLPMDQVRSVQNVVETMKPQHRAEMLRDIIQNMAERADSEEIAKFVVAQLGGDAMEVAFSYASRDRK